MLTLILFVTLAIVVSFYCSLLESAFLSITPAYVQACQNDKPAKGRKLASLKQELERPLAAILSLNTIAHTLGATGAGAQATILFGSQWIGVFSAVLTLAILIFSEVIPKSLGAIHWRKLAGFVVSTLPVLIIVTYPLVWISVHVSKLLQHKKPQKIMRSEILALATLGKDEGAISHDESEFIESLLKFRDVKVDSVMTPGSVVVSVDESETVQEVLAKDIPFSRIPVFSQNPEKLTGYVLKDDLHDAGRDSNDQYPVGHFKRPIFSININSNLRFAVKYFLKNRCHIAAATNDDGIAYGIVTLEDTVEALLGWEIVDEFDPTPNMRKLGQKSDSTA